MQVEEVLYSAMEDFYIDIMLGSGDGSRSVHLDLPPFTLVGATTRAGMLSNPLRARLEFRHILEYYTERDLEEIVKRTADILKWRLQTKVRLRLLAKPRYPTYRKSSAEARSRFCANYG